MNLDLLPSADALDSFAPALGTSEASFQQEVDRKRVWVRKLQGKPAWLTKEEVSTVPPLEMHPLSD